MGLNLEADGQAALDLAKRSLPEDGELDARLLAAALCHGAPLQDLYPALAARLTKYET
jgi:hypothetical protein